MQSLKNVEFEREAARCCRFPSLTTRSITISENSNAHKKQRRQKQQKKKQTRKGYISSCRDDMRKNKRSKETNNKAKNGFYPNGVLKT